MTDVTGGDTNKKLNEMYIMVIQMQSAVNSMQRDLSELKEDQKTSFVSKERFENQKAQTERRLQLLERIVYGAVGLILTAVIVALVSLVVSSGGITP